MSFNATINAGNPYENIELSSLSWIEQQWAAWYIWIGNPVIATGLLTLLVHEIAYFGRCVPFIIIDAMPSMRKYKIQANKIPTPAEQWECTKFVLFSHFTMEAPIIWLFQPVAEYLGMQTYQVPFPSWQKMLFHIFLFFFFEDFFHFVAHQLLHTPILYKHIHKIHHRYSAPFGLAAEYAHPAEVAILGTGTVGGPLLWCWLTGDLHLFTIQVWITLRLFQAIDSHSGYDFPWSLQHILPFWSGADHHDFHHMAFSNNFSTSFRWWDRIFGTDTKYLEYKKKVAAMKKKTGSKQEQLKAEQELLAEVERVGAIEEQNVVDIATGKGKAA